jgi:hypothetical protein
MRITLLVILFSILLQSCISLSKKESIDTLVPEQTKNIDLEIYLKSSIENTCVSQDQIDFLKKSIGFYFADKIVSSNSKFYFILLHESEQDRKNEFMSSLYNELSKITLTILPVFRVDIFKFEIYSVDLNLRYGGKFIDESMYSIWGLPFYFNKEVVNVRRNNFLNSISKSVKNIKTEKSMLDENFFIPKVCNGFKELFRKQKW